MANIVDPDETAHYEPTHRDLQCLQNQLLLYLVLKGLHFTYKIIKLKKSDVSLLFITCTLTHLSSIRQFYGHKDGRRREKIKIKLLKKIFLFNLKHIWIGEKKITKIV